MPDPLTKAMQSEELPSLTQESLLRILEVTRQLAHPYKIIDMLTEVVEAGKSVLLADRGSVWLYDEGQEALVMKVPEFTPPPTLQPVYGLLGEGVTGFCH